MEVWKKHAAVRDWYTPGKRMRAYEFLSPPYSKKGAQRWLKAHAHKYKQSAFEGYPTPNH